jgi:hypothetical protein
MRSTRLRLPIMTYNLSGEIACRQRSCYLLLGALMQPLYAMILQLVLSKPAPERNLLVHWLSDNVCWLTTPREPTVRAAKGCTPPFK